MLKNHKKKIQTKKVKGKNLKPGDCIVQPHPGIVTKVDSKGKDPFWNIPNISFMDFYDCIYGGLTGPLKLNDKYEILVDRKDIVEMQKNISNQLSEHILDSMDRRKSFKKVCMKKLISIDLKKKKK